MFPFEPLSQRPRPMQSIDLLLLQRGGCGRSMYSQERATLGVHPASEHQSAGGAHVAAKAHMLGRPRHLCSRIPCPRPVSSPGRTQCLLLGVPPLWRRWAGKTHGVGGMTCALVGSQAGGCQRVRSARAAPRRCVPHVCALASSTRSALPQRARRGFLNGRSF